jgi:hypothetical protein
VIKSEIVDCGIAFVYVKVPSYNGLNPDSRNPNNTVEEKRYFFSFSKHVETIVKGKSYSSKQK